MDYFLYILTIVMQDETKIYNVQAKAGEFIIGEVGKINVNSGQTLEVIHQSITQTEKIRENGKFKEYLLICDFHSTPSTYIH